MKIFHSSLELCDCSVCSIRVLPSPFHALTLPLTLAVTKEKLFTRDFAWHQSANSTAGRNHTLPHTPSYH